MSDLCRHGSRTCPVCGIDHDAKTTRYWMAHRPGDAEPVPSALDRVFVALTIATVGLIAALAVAAMVHP